MLLLCNFFVTPVIPKYLFLVFRYDGDHFLLQCLNNSTTDFKMIRYFEQKNKRNTFIFHTMLFGVIAGFFCLTNSLGHWLCKKNFGCCLVNLWKGIQIAWQNKYIRIKINLNKCFANWWNIGGWTLICLIQAISNNWDEYDQEETTPGETTTHHVLRRTESEQSNRTSIGCNVEGGEVGGNQLTK